MQQDRDVKWVKGLDRHFLECRSLRHAWRLDKFQTVARDETSIKVETSAQLIQRRLYCLRCETTRIDYYIRNAKDRLNGFRRHSSRYVYPKGYTFKGSEHALQSPSINDYVFESYRREEA